MSDDQQTEIIRCITSIGLKVDDQTECLSKLDERTEKMTATLAEHSTEIRELNIALAGDKKRETEGLVQRFGKLKDDVKKTERIAMYAVGAFGALGSILALLRFFKS